MDKLSFHDFEGEEILEEWFVTMGIELLHTPSYSPDLNAIELCFNKRKSELNGNLREIVHSNINLAIAEAVEGQYAVITTALAIGSENNGHKERYKRN